MRISIDHKGVTYDWKRYCIRCDKPLDESKAVVVPRATPEEEATAEVINYLRDFPEVGFADSRWWCGDCWRVDPINSRW